MATEIIAGIGLFKTMLDIAKGLKDIDNAVARNSIAIELTDKILTAQRAQTALTDEVGTLKTQVAELEHWEATKQRYDLQEIVAGIFAYVLKPNVQPPEPTHKACPNCYTDRRISILQQEMRPGRRTFLACHRCGLGLNLTGGQEPTPPPVNTGGSSWTRSRRMGSGRI